MACDRSNELFCCQKICLLVLHIPHDDVLLLVATGDDEAIWMEAHAAEARLLVLHTASFAKHTCDTCALFSP